MSGFVRGLWVWGQMAREMQDFEVSRRKVGVRVKLKLEKNSNPSGKL